jgi:20S proteasome alpha/beta subunit
LSEESNETAVLAAAENNAQGSNAVISCSPSYSLDNRGHHRQDPILRRYEGEKMTFTYACLSEGGIVLAADSQVTFEQTVGGTGTNVVATYLGERSKIRRIGTHSAFSMAGKSWFADTLLQALERDQTAMQSSSFNEAVTRCREVFRRELDRMQSPVPDITLMFCGFANMFSGKPMPKIVKLSTATGFDYMEVGQSEPAWTGAVEHGAALYLHHRFHPRERLLSLEQAKFLAYCIVKEVADMDNTVGGQIEMEVITELESKPFTDIERFENKRKTLAETIRSAIESA